MRAVNVTLMSNIRYQTIVPVAWNIRRRQSSAVWERDADPKVRYRLSYRVVEAIELSESSTSGNSSTGKTTSAPRRIDIGESFLFELEIRYDPRLQSFQGPRIDECSGPGPG